MSICLWFDQEAEQAAQFYCGIFQDSAMGAISRYGKEGFEFHGKPEGTAMTVAFRLNGMNFMALNGGPVYKINEAISIVVSCNSQEEIDHYWQGLGNGGVALNCGWMKDRYGLCWQIVPAVLEELMTDQDPAKVQRVTQAFMQMKKFDIAALLQAAEG